MTRLPLAIVLAALLGLSGCSDDAGDNPPEKVAARDAVNPCTLAFDDQQIATTLEPTTPAMKPAKLDGSLAAGLAADGVCFDIFYEMYAKGWKVEGYHLTASKDGVTYSDDVPHATYLTQFDENKVASKPLPGLYVPLRGCVDVTGRVDLTGPAGKRGSYSATATYGRDCMRAEKSKGTGSAG